MSRDTTESDLKQRREISSGTAYYVDQCAVRAATKGRVLLLEGIEKAERNVLPVLNNLLENRLVRSGIYFMILIFIFWLLLFFLRKAFAEKVFIGYQYFRLTYFLLYFFKGDAIRGWKIPDGSWKIWFSFKSMATADFEWILLYGLTSTYTSTWIVISLRGHVTSFQKIIISIKINNQSKTQSFTSMWQFTYC